MGLPVPGSSRHAPRAVATARHAERAGYFPFDRELFRPPIKRKKAKGVAIGQSQVTGNPQAPEVSA